jgi:N-acetyl-gamma-glutamyl-phosphate reductase
VASRIGIVGASGYGGAELVRLLDAHPDLDVEVLAARQQAGQPLASLFPNLAGDRVLEEIDLGRLIGLDLVFLGTPHGPSLQLGAALADAGTRVVDLSGAFRLAADDFGVWYGEGHPRPELTPDPTDTSGDARRAVYGMPELGLRDAVADATLVANPGCYPSAALLALAPVARLLVPGSVIVDGKSGTSGAGRGLADRLHHANADGSLVAYGAPAHRHTGEIETYLPGDLGPISFTPHLAPMPRGLMTTCYGQAQEGVGADDVAGALADAYADEPFVHVLPSGTFPQTKALAGSNGCQVSALLDERTRRIVVTSAIDNLGKGAAGAALQNANLMLGLDETRGLSAHGIFP